MVFQSWATSGRSPTAQRHGRQRLRLPDQHLVVAARRPRSAAARASSAGSSSPSGGSVGAARRAASVNSSPSSAGQLGGRDLAGARPPTRSSGRSRGAASSSSPSASSRRRSGSRSSNSRNTSRRRERSGSRASDSSRSTSTSTSRTAVASCLDTRASSAWLVRFSLRLAPEISSMFDSTPSRSPYSWSSWRGGLLADARDAGDVVRGVALQAGEVGHQLGRDPVAVDHRVAVVDLGLGDPAAGGHHPDAGLDQLEQVAVAGHDHHVDVLLARLVASEAITSSASKPSTLTLV